MFSYLSLAPIRIDPRGYHFFNALFYLDEKDKISMLLRIIDIVATYFLGKVLVSFSPHPIICSFILYDHL